MHVRACAGVRARKTYCSDAFSLPGKAPWLGQTGFVARPDLIARDTHHVLLTGKKPACGLLAKSPRLEVLDFLKPGILPRRWRSFKKYL